MMSPTRTHFIDERASSATSRRGSRRNVRSIIMVVLAALVVAACSGAGDEDPGDVTPPETPAPEASESGEQDPPEAGEEADEPAHAVTVFFVRSGDDRLWVEPEVHWAVGSTELTPQSAMSTLFLVAPHDPVLTSSIPSGVEVLEVTVEDSTLIVDVDGALRGHSTGSAGEIAFAEQLAHTATSLPGVESVVLYIDGAPIDELWGHLDWSQPITPDPFALSPITIENPAHGATVPAGDVVAEGQATVFEAHFLIRLRDASGAIVEEGPVTATAGGPERGTWSVTFTITEPGSYLIEAEEEDASGGEGRAPMLVHREFTVVAP